MMDDGLTHNHKEILKRILRPFAHKIDAVGLFGSRATGKYRENSDIDLVIYGHLTEADVDRLWTLCDASALPMKVDVNAYALIAYPPLKAHIDAVMRPLFTQQDLLAPESGEDTTQDQMDLEPDGFADQKKRDRYFVLQQGGDGVEGWRTGQLQEIANITMGQSPEGETCNTERRGTPLLNGPTEFGLKSPDPVQFTTDPKKFASKNDILFCVRGSTTGKMNWADQVYAIGRGVAAIRHKNGTNYQRFLRGVLDFNLGSLLSCATGSTFPNVSKDQLESLELFAPPLPEQKAIAGVLGSLDDKIDLLHRQNKTLEALAETLFRQWFIEEAQEEWEEKPLSGVADFLNGLACQKFPPENETERLPVLKIRELTSGLTDTSDWVTSKVRPEYIVQAGDVIFSWSASLMVKIWDGAECVLNQHLFKVTSSLYPKWFYYFWCRQHLAEFQAKAAAHATTMGHIKRGDLDEAKVLVPSPLELEAMTRKIQPLLDRQISNAKKIRTLEKLRDTLLPKLMSGDVRVVV